MSMARTSDLEQFVPQIVVLYCRQCIADDTDAAEAAKSVAGIDPRFVMMSCSSKIEPSHLLKLLDQGADGVAVVGCPQDRCRFLVGNTMAEKRIEYTRGLLDKIGMGAERVAMERGTGLSAAQLAEVAERRAAAVKALGPSPMRGLTEQ